MRYAVVVVSAVVSAVWCTARGVMARVRRAGVGLSINSSQIEKESAEKLASAQKEMSDKAEQLSSKMAENQTELTEKLSTAEKDLNEKINKKQNAA